MNVIQPSKPASKKSPRKRDSTGASAFYLPEGEDALMARAAWAYYVEGLTQQEIAQKFDLNRVRINRMLAQARERGIVQVRVNGSLFMEHEARLESRYGLKRALVVPTPADVLQLPRSIAMAAGHAVSDRLAENMSIGVGWGRTLRLSVDSMERKPLRNLSVVSLIGGLTQGSVLNTHETASKLADTYNASCFYIAAPALADSEESAHVLRTQTTVADAIDHARAIDIAFVSVGGLNKSATLRSLRIVSDDEVRSLVAAGAVGDLCSQFIDIHGKVVDHPINHRVIALPVPDLARVPTVILASGGKEKLEVLHGTLSLGVVSILVTDEETARSLGQGKFK